MVDRVLGGWQVTSILTFADGTPINTGGIGDRASVDQDNWPDATGISPIPSVRTTERFWNRDAFDPNHPDLRFRNGSVGRNVLITPGTRQWDFSLLKNTRIKEGHELEFRFEAFNFGNHPNYNAPSSDTRSSTFGVITSARTMRELQFGLKYSF